VTTSNSDFINEVLRLTNEFRAQNGLAPLTANLELNAAAQGHSEDMANQDYFSHTGSDGSSVQERAQRVGYEAGLILDNIAVGNGTPKGTVDQWIDSPGHLAQLVNPNFTELGVGYAYLENDTGNSNWGHYWTQVFGTGDTNPATNLPTATPTPIPTPVPTSTKGDFQAMLDELGAFESGKPKGDPQQYQSENQFGFMGKYQFGEPLLIDLGYYQADTTPSTNDWQDAAWTGKDGITSKDSFKNSPQVQETVIRAAFVHNAIRIEAELQKAGKSALDYLGQVKTFSDGKTIEISISGLLAGAHLSGPGGVAALLLNDVVSVDANGTPITQYVDTYGGYAVTLADFSSVTVPVTLADFLSATPPVTPTPTPEPVPTPEPIPEPTPEPTDDSLPTAPPLSGSVLDGTDGNDLEIGSDGSDVIHGSAGEDTICGRASNDNLFGDANNDWMFGNQANDFVEGGIGDDIAFGGQGEDTVLGGTGADTLLGNLGDDSLYGEGSNDWMFGNQGAEVLKGGEGEDILYGGKGNDTLQGEVGSDFLLGDLDNDFLVGADPNVANAGAGEIDTLLGGEGADTFALGDSLQAYYNDGNTGTSGLGDYALILDFNPAEDSIQLSGSSASYRFAAAAVYRISSGTEDELIGIIQGSQVPMLNESYFEFM
jgi:Ca2+-binding RTX toxin-like protein